MTLCSIYMYGMLVLFLSGGSVSSGLGIYNTMQYIYVWYVGLISLRWQCIIWFRNLRHYAVYIWYLLGISMTYLIYFKNDDCASHLRFAQMGFRSK